MSDSLRLPLAQSAIDRDYLLREDPEVFEILWANSHTRVLPVHRGKVLLDDAQGLKLFPVSAFDSIQQRIYLGKSLVAQGDQPIGTPLVLAVLDDEAARALEADEAKWLVLRRTGAGLSARDAGMYAQSLAIANWHATHLHCVLCGAPTEPGKAGWIRRCTNDGKESYPRTDPAVIVSVVDDNDRLLMGSQGVWEENRWSVLAGFVEPGESLNATVEREMFEEAGVRVTDIDYLGSQSWPFPYSLMLGFTCRARGEQQHIADGIEIEKLRWFSRDDLINEIDSLLLPGPLTIARSLIEHWFGGPLPAGTRTQ